MKITIIGAGGNIGQRITKEAAARNHDLRLITSKSKEFFDLESVIIQSVNILNTEGLIKLLEGSDVLISAYAPPMEDTDLLLAATKSLIAASKKAAVRLIAVGGAGSLKVNETTQLIDSLDFPEDYKPIAAAHRKALETIYNHEKEVNWTNVSPPISIFEGKKSNQFRIGEDHLLVDEKGESAISMEDFAVGILNEVENPKFIKKRFTIAY